MSLSEPVTQPGGDQEQPTAAVLSERSPGAFSVAETPSHGDWVDTAKLVDKI